MMKNLMFAAGAGLWGALVFLFALQVHFPSTTAIERAKWEVQEQTKGAWAIEADDAGIWRLSGLRLENLVVSSITKGRRGDPTTSAPFLRLDEARARVSILPLLMGTIDGMFDLRLFNGEIEGTVRRDDDAIALAAKGEELDLSTMPLDGESFSLDASGIATLELDLALAQGEDGENSGTFALDIKDLVLGSASVAGIDLPTASFTEAILELELDGDKGTIETGRFMSDILEIELDGSLTLKGTSTRRWRMKIEAEVNLLGELENIGAFMPKNMKQAQDDDGTFHFLCTGSVANPRCRPNRTKVRRNTSRTTTTSTKTTTTTDKETDAASASSRKDRQARIQERRERMKERRAQVQDEPEFDEDEEGEFEEDDDEEAEEGDGFDDAVPGLEEPLPFDEDLPYEDD